MRMVEVTRLNGEKFLVDPQHVDKVEFRGDDPNAVIWLWPHLRGFPDIVAVEETHRQVKLALQEASTTYGPTPVKAADWCG